MERHGDLFDFGILAIPAVAVSIICAALLALLFLRLLFRRDRGIRIRIYSMAADTLLIFLLAWKLSPLITDFSLFIRDPLLLLYFPGRHIHFILAAAGVLLYLLWKFLHHKISRRLFLGYITLLLTLLIFHGLLWSLVFKDFRLSEPPDQETTGVHVGYKAPLPQLFDSEGRKQPLVLPEEGVLILNFWASWCPPCRAEIPELEAFLKLPGVQGVRLYGINLTAMEKSQSDLQRFLQETPPAIPLLFDETGKAGSLYEIESIPTTLVIDAGGTILARKTGPVSLDWLRRWIGEG